ncbi:hypothetical protein ABEY41_03070 [Peribacillus butanolivorans]|uniref:hypothetical protein n=1 Tax=Peribacillus butanolivorans TaxID=421767 RepID=UPI003D27C29B
MNITVLDGSLDLPLIFLLIILCLISFLSIIMIVKNEKTDKKEDIKNLFFWIEKKDILYWLLIVCLGSISCLTFQYSGDKDALSHWSFAGTIVSIILAVVAIGFTLFQTLASNLSSEKIAISADKIEKASNGLNVDELIKAGEIITNVSNDILSHNEKLQNQVHELNEELRSLKTEQKKYYSMFDNFIGSSTKSGVADTIFNVTEADFINKIYRKLPLMQQFFVYSLFKFQEQEINFPKKPKPTEEFLMKFKEFTSINIKVSYDEEFVNGVNYGTLLAVMNWLKFLGYKRENNSFPEGIYEGLKNHGREAFKGEDIFLEFLDDFIKEVKNEEE